MVRNCKKWVVDAASGCAIRVNYGRDTAGRAFPDLSLAIMSFAGAAFERHRLSLKGPDSLDPYAGDTVVWVYASSPGCFPRAPRRRRRCGRAGPAAAGGRS